MNAYYLQVLYNKKGLQKPLNANKVLSNYLFITYIVTSKPKRISVAAGVVHIIFSFFKFYTHRVYNHIMNRTLYRTHQENHELQAKKNPAETGFNLLLTKRQLSAW